MITTAHSIAFLEVPPCQNPLDIANHALVFMAGRWNTRWKQVIPYHFTGRSIYENVLKNLVFYLIDICFSTSLKVLVIASDMGAANRAMWRLPGLSSHRHSETVCFVSHSHPHLDGKELLFMADPVHVLKNIRTQLFHYIPLLFRYICLRRRRSERAQSSWSNCEHRPC